MRFWEQRGRVRQVKPGVFVLDYGYVMSSLERECLQGAANGEEASDTAKRLRYSTEHIRATLKKLYPHLEARNKTHAVAIAWRAGVIS